MNNRKLFEKNIGTKTPSNIEVIDQDKPLPIRDWQQRYERHLALVGRKATRERYARALERFFENHPGKKYGHEFLRPSIIDYVETRLKEGASVATVRLELSAVRGLFQFAMAMGASDLMFNPARGLRVSQPAKKQPVGHVVERPDRISSNSASASFGSPGTFAPRKEQ